MTGLTDQAKSVVLKFWDHYKMGMNIRYDIRLKKPMTMPALMSNKTYRPIFRKGISYTHKTRGLRGMHSCEINPKVCDIAKVGKDWYEIIKNYAQKVGVPVPAEASTTETPTVEEASCSEASTMDASTAEGK